MNRVSAISLFILFATLAYGHQKTTAPRQKISFKTKQFINSHAVDFDANGRCKAVDGTFTKRWTVASFPASIAHFETCISVVSTTTKGMVDFELIVEDKRGRSICSVQGVMSLGDSGAASQAVDWDHLQIPRAGVYYMSLVIQGEKVGKYTMVFSRARKSK